MKTRLVFICLILLVLTNTAHAQAVVLDQMVDTFRDAALSWNGKLIRYAQGTFYLLALIELAWAATRLGLAKADISEWAATLINEIMFLGLFLWLMTTLTTWGPAIINSFRDAAATAGGVRTITPGDILILGVNMSGKILDAVSAWPGKATFILILSGVIICICFAWITVEMIVALVESWTIIGIGVLLMAFGASRWTKDVSVGLIRHIFGIGVRLFILQVFAALGNQLASGWINQLGDMSSQAMMLMVGCSIVLLGVVIQVPKSIERAVSGTSSAGGGALVGAGLGVAGGLAAVGRAAATAATGMAGLGAAVGQAAQLAQQQIAASPNPPQSRGGYASAMIGQTASNLASGGARDIGNRLSGQSPGYGSTPWRIASSLGNDRRLLSEEQNRPPPPPPPSNSISGGNNP